MKKRGKQPVNKRKAESAYLRKRAEDILSSTVKVVTPKITFKNPEQLINELQVYQVELEMQNEELKRSQESLEEEKSRFATIFNHAPVGFLVLDHLTIINDCNAMALSMLASDKVSLKGKRFQLFVAPESQEPFYSFIKKLLDTSKTVLTELSLLNARGKKFYGQIQGSHVRGSDNLSAFYYLTIVDITEKHVADIKLQETTARLQLALKASLSGTLTVNLKSGVVQPDNSVLELFELNDRIFDGSLAMLYKCIVNEDIARVDKRMRETMQNSAHLNETFRIITTSGQVRHIEIHGRCVSIESTNDYFIGLITDISKKENQKKQAELLKQQQHSDMLRAVIQTQEEERLRISNALHDSLGQLLYSASLKLQRANTVKDPFFSEAASIISQAISETRKISFELAPSILSDYGIAVAVREMATRMESDSLKIETGVSGLNHRLSLETETDIFRIVQELVNNIVKHSFATRANIKITFANDEINLCVQDNGKGIITENNKTHGTGLSSIRNRIALYDGTLKIACNAGKGTKVTIKLKNISATGNAAV